MQVFCHECAPHDQPCALLVLSIDFVVRVTDVARLQNGQVMLMQLTGVLQGLMRAARVELRLGPFVYEFQISHNIHIRDPPHIAEGAANIALNTGLRLHSSSATLTVTSRGLFWRTELRRTWQTSSQVQADIEADILTRGTLCSISVYVHNMRLDRSEHRVSAKADTLHATASEELACVAAMRTVVQMFSARVRAQDTAMSSSVLRTLTVGLRLHEQRLPTELTAHLPLMFPRASTAQTLFTVLTALDIHLTSWGARDTSVLQNSPPRTPALLALLGPGFVYGAMAAERRGLTPCQQNASRLMDELDCLCDAGHVDDRGVCVTCPAGTYALAPASEQCSKCDPAFYCHGGTHRIACPVNARSQAGAPAAGFCFCGAGYIARTDSDALLCDLLLGDSPAPQLTQLQFTFALDFSVLTGLQAQPAEATGIALGVGLSSHVVDLISDAIPQAMVGHPDTGYEYRVSGENVWGYNGFAFDYPRARSNYPSRARGGRMFQTASRLLTLEGGLQGGDVQNSLPADALADTLCAFVLGTDPRLRSSSSTFLCGVTPHFSVQEGSTYSANISIDLTQLGASDAQRWIECLTTLQHALRDNALLNFGLHAVRVVQAVSLSLQHHSLYRPQDVLGMLQAPSLRVSSMHVSFLIVQDISLPVPSGLIMVLSMDEAFAGMVARISHPGYQCDVSESPARLLQQCPPNSVQRNGLCRCGPGFHGTGLASSSFSCVVCGRGHFCPGDGLKVACPGDTLSIGGGAVNIFTDLARGDDCRCPPGAFRTVLPTAEAGHSCTLCPHGHYCADGVVLTACMPNSWSLSGSVHSTACQCEAGYAVPRGGSVACMPCTPCVTTATFEILLDVVDLSVLGGSLSTATQQVVEDAAMLAGLPPSAVKITGVSGDYLYRCEIKPAMRGEYTPPAASVVTGVYGVVRLIAAPPEVFCAVLLRNDEDLSVFRLFAQATQELLGLPAAGRRRLLLESGGPLACQDISAASVGTSSVCVFRIGSVHSFVLGDIASATPAWLTPHLTLYFQFTVAAESAVLYDSDAVEAHITDVFEEYVDTDVTAMQARMGAGRDRGADSVHADPTAVQFEIRGGVGLSVKATTALLEDSALLTRLARGMPPDVVNVTIFTNATTLAGVNCAAGATGPSCACPSTDLCTPLPADSLKGCVSPGHECLTVKRRNNFRIEIWGGMFLTFSFVMGILAGFTARRGGKVPPIPITHVVPVVTPWRGANYGHYRENSYGFF